MGNKILRAQEGVGRSVVVNGFIPLLKAGYVAEAFPSTIITEDPIRFRRNIRKISTMIVARKNRKYRSRKLPN
jgi:hypothetical protein